ncbi:hypothetical protein [Lysinibacillus fusiformis]|uniref:hypothetical protein n=1 Tax=Lysinibacillus fusiformis TaxID=28031 RepID=UPI000D3A5D01|nr:MULTISPECIES: hypothetical protein [Lysinibacillus]MED4668041.1 hypothetical protein [Lysinibacillus fusiformis]QAS58455.1 hypothetical protein LSP_20095 [Lysinibacillus sphaericus]RDV35547.1 hypothetical protein C7B90_03020 [Lysinibacillus fusiformis]
MQVVINVKGTKLSVLSIHRAETGQLLSVYAKDENGREARYIDKERSQYDTSPHVAIENLEGALEYPEVEARIIEERNKLILHLEQSLITEQRKLDALLVDLGETEVEYPFEKLGEKLIEKQSEYKFAQQRVFGMLDTVEEAKAYAEGYFLNGNCEAIETQSSN